MRYREKNFFWPWSQVPQIPNQHLDVTSLSPISTTISIITSWYKVWCWKIANHQKCTLLKQVPESRHSNWRSQYDSPRSSWTRACGLIIMQASGIVVVGSLFLGDLFDSAINAVVSGAGSALSAEFIIRSRGERKSCSHTCFRLIGP